MAEEAAYGEKIVSNGITLYDPEDYRGFVREPLPSPLASQSDRLSARVDSPKSDGPAEGGSRYGSLARPAARVRFESSRVSVASSASPIRHPSSGVPPVEITAAMIEAGVDVLWEWLGDGRDQNEPPVILEDVVRTIAEATATRR